MPSGSLWVRSERRIVASFSKLSAGGCGVGKILCVALLFCNGKIGGPLGCEEEKSAPKLARGKPAGCVRSVAASGSPQLGKVSGQLGCGKGAPAPKLARGEPAGYVRSVAASGSPQLGKVSGQLGCGKLETQFHPVTESGAVKGGEALLATCLVRWSTDNVTSFLQTKIMTAVVLRLKKKERGGECV